MMDVEIDNVSVVLLSILAGLLVYLRFFSRPEPLVHPLLLGKQSEVSKVRQEGETGVYRSWATGQDTPLSIRPASMLKTVKDVVLGPRARSTAVQRCIMDTSLTDESLAEIIRLIPLGLHGLFDFSNDIASPSPILAVLPSSPSTALPLLLLHLAATPSAPLVILPTPQMLSPALNEQAAHPLVKVLVVHASLAEDVIEQVYEDRQNRIGILIVGDPNKEKDYVVQDAKSHGINVRYWEELWEAAEGSKVKLSEPEPKDIHSYFYSAGEDGSPDIVKVTHQNITSGIAGVLSTFPADKRPTAALGDTVASAVSLNTPLGMSIAMAMIWSGAGLRLIGDPSPTWETDDDTTPEEDLTFLMSSSDQPAPTVLFLTPKYYQAILQKLHTGFVGLPFASFIATHLFSQITSGYLSRQHLTSRMGLGALRRRILGGIVGDKLRAVTVVGQTPPPSTMAMSHMLLGVPTSRLHPSPRSAGPIFASHFYDLQIPSVPNHLTPLSFDSDSGEGAHTGPPAVNIEAKLVGKNVDSDVVGGEPLEGRLWAGGPGLLQMALRESSEDTRWIDLGESAKVQTNGTFIVGPSRVAT